jgi:protein TonB
VIAARSGNRHWLVGGGIATAAHAVVLAGVLLVQPATPDNLAEQPVVLVELPPQAGPAPAAQAEQAEAQPQPEYVPPQQFMPQVEAPRVRAPLPRDIVTTPPPPPPLPVRRMVAAPLAAAPAAPPRNALATMPAGAGSGTAATPGDDPKAKREEADYYALLSAHLNRKKRYPSEAKKARQQGVVTVRFTVHSDGRISGSSIRNSSGHELLDRATLELMERVAPLPKFPRSMTRDSVTISLPIDYSLRTR